MAHGFAARASPRALDADPIVVRQREPYGSRGHAQRGGHRGTYAAPCAAFAAAADGDVIELDSKGILRRRRLQHQQEPADDPRRGRTRQDRRWRRRDAQGKAIWVVQGSDTTIENVELTGAAVPDMNGAGIRQEGKNLTVRGCLFHDNENGILAGDVAGSEILIETSEFDHNGAGRRLLAQPVHQSRRQAHVSLQLVAPFRSSAIC